MIAAFLLLLCAFDTIVLSQKLPDAPVEWLELKVAASKFSDPNIVSIGPSELHGRGVMLAKNVKKAGRLPLLQFFEVSMLGADYLEQGEGGMVYRAGFIPTGSDLDIKAEKKGSILTPEEAIKACEGHDDCVGITYFAADAPDKYRPEASILFKGKGNVIEGANWHSYVKSALSVSQVYYPLGCNSQFLSRYEVEASSPRDVVACSPRLINHSCRPTCRMVSESMGDEFAIPGMPWTKGRVQGMYLHALTALGAGTELSVDYNTIPYVMSTEEKAMFQCKEEEEDKDKDKDKDKGGEL